MLTLKPCKYCVSTWQCILYIDEYVTNNACTCILYQVVHRDEQRFGSLQQRKRVAVSVADPMDYLTQSPIDTSSEFTRRLTSEEILQLNQRQPLQSPSDRLRLFSFTKRHLKLPFSRNKNKRDKEKLISPEKEPYKSMMPQRQKRSSPTSARFSTSEKSDGK